MGRDLKGQREPVPWTDKELKQAKNEARKAGRDPDAVKGPPPMLNLQLSKEQFSHSNVARLFRAFPDDKTSSGYHPVIPPANKGGQR
jgi:hypothetical protein